jgi:prephenate dehydrogenase
MARKMHAIDSGSQDLSIIRDADMVILATPVNIIIKEAKEISKIIKPGCIICDVGSTKNEIVSKLTKILPGFVGTHPIAGSEKRGMINADSSIFKNSLCILTPVKNTDNTALNKVKNFWLKLGARIIIMDPRQHDKILSYVSHLPHAIAFSLINSIPAGHFRFTANSLRDTTRIAASDTGLWLDIFLSNRNNILKSIKVFEHNLSLLKKSLTNKDRKSLRRILSKAKAQRIKLH